MNQNEIKSVIALEPFERYKYLIKKVADFEVFYTLIDEKGHYAISELDDNKLFPIWATKDYAELCKLNGWETYTVKELDLDDLEDRLIDFIVDEDCLINVFPVYDKTGFVVNVNEFTRDLGEELKNYE